MESPSNHKVWFSLIFAVVIATMMTGIAAANPVIFVTQTPIATEPPMNIVSAFGNHQAGPQFAPRGGDLYIRYDDSTLKNLTQVVGYGTTAGLEIAVREPCVYWDGSKALFSMVVGGTTGSPNVFWQIYEVTNLGKLQTPVITKIPQPASYNNIAPMYGSDDSIIFTSDRPRNGDPTLYPQLDEYRTTPTVTGIWSMAPDGSNLHVLTHSPDGDFNPRLDSFGRVVFGRWDHLQRDPQAETDIDRIILAQPAQYGAITYNSETTSVFHTLAPGDELFPEAAHLYPTGATQPNPVWNTDHFYDDLNREFNQFFPWAMDESGTNIEILNHLGRHELLSTINHARVHLPVITNGGDGGTSPRLLNFLYPRESPTQPGFYYGVDAGEFGTHAAGEIVALNAPLGTNADDIRTTYITHVQTRSPIPNISLPNANQIGFFRDPVPMTDGTLWAAHSTSPYVDSPVTADPGAPNPYPLSSHYDFSIKKLVLGANGFLVNGIRLVPAGISKSVSYFDPAKNRNVTYNGALWELWPCEVVARSRPTPNVTPLPAIEQALMLSTLGSQARVNQFQNWLTQNNYALIVSRDVTRRADKQQEYSLKVKWSTHVSTDGSTTPFELAWFQMFEGDQVRGYTVTTASATGRRVIPRPLTSAPNPSNVGAPSGAVKIGDDGSIAAIVPARRAMAWQTTDITGFPVVRERYWVSFQPGEMRTCTNCHGINHTDVLGNTPPTNSPQALATLLTWWDANNPAPAAVKQWEAYR